MSRGAGVFNLHQKANVSIVRQHETSQIFLELLEPGGFGGCCITRAAAPGRRRRTNFWDSGFRSFDPFLVAPTLENTLKYLLVTSSKALAFSMQCGVLSFYVLLVACWNSLEDPKRTCLANCVVLMTMLWLGSRLIK